MIGTFKYTIMYVSLFSSMSNVKLSKMKNKKLFEKTVNILVKAYKNGTLKHQLCQACAVGNIIAYFNPEIKRIGDLPCSDYVWFDVVMSFRQLKRDYDSENYDRGLKHIRQTSYSIADISTIEQSFERADKGDSEESYMFNGLMSVVDCLMIIHEANETETIYAKSLFVKETA